MKNEAKHCDHCGKVALYVRETTITVRMPYGNPYLPPKWDVWDKTTYEYACQKHFEESAKMAILGPHRWKEIKE